MHSRRQPQLDRCIQSASAWEGSGQALFSVQTLVLHHCCWINAAVGLGELDFVGCEQQAAAVAGNKDWWDVDKGRKWEIVREMRNSWRRLLARLVKAGVLSRCFPNSVLTMNRRPEDSLLITKRVCKCGARSEAEADSVAAERSFFFITNEHIFLKTRSVILAVMYL